MGRRARLLKLFLDISASYWFVPSLLVLFGIALSGVTIWFDHYATEFTTILPASLVDTQSEGARSTLAVIAQSIIGVTGVMFSMTLVAVSFASGNFGPRLVGNFMRDRGNQWSLGILISTFVYALIVLRSVQDQFEGGAEQFVPQYSLIVALLLTLLCVFTLIYFIHHVPETINVSRISASLGNQLDHKVRNLIDDQTGQKSDLDWPSGDATYRIQAGHSGYIQTCNTKRLYELANDNDWYIDMHPATGDFLMNATVVFSVWSNTVLSDEDQNNIRACYAIGPERTENQNPTFVAEQLVEMVARALSPGVNDPFTAMDCLNRLTSSLTVAGTYGDGLSPDPQGRVQIPVLTFDTLFETTFPKCRQYVGPDHITCAHALDLLRSLQNAVPKRFHGPIIAEIDALTSNA